MRWRQVILLWIVCAALGAQWWLVERVRTPPLDPDAMPRARFLDVRMADVAAIRLERSGRRLVIRRDGGYWRVVEPAGVAVPSDLVAAFMDALVTAEEIEQVPSTTGDVRTFGFDDDAGRVELTMTGAPPAVVLLGGENPTGTAVYARRANGPGIVMIGRNVLYYAQLLLDVVPRGSGVPVDAVHGRVGG